jgi:hypothetical protein
MTPAQALAFVEQHGIVLEAARRGAIPSLADAVAGEMLRGSWWAHPQGRAIFVATRAMRDSSQVLVCRLVDGKISFVHERLWPAVVRLGDRFPAQRLARLHEVHTENGRHHVDETPFPTWVPGSTAALAKDLTESQARAMLAMLPIESGSPR